MLYGTKRVSHSSPSPRVLLLRGLGLVTVRGCRLWSDNQVRSEINDALFRKPEDGRVDGPPLYKKLPANITFLLQGTG